MFLKIVTLVEGVSVGLFLAVVWEIAVHLAVTCDVYDVVFCALLFPTKCLG